MFRVQAPLPYSAPGGVEPLPKRAAANVAAPYLWRFMEVDQAYPPPSDGSYTTFITAGGQGLVGDGMNPDTYKKEVERMWDKSLALSLS